MKIDALEYFAGELFKIKMGYSHLKNWSYESDTEGKKTITIEYYDGDYLK